MQEIKTLIHESVCSNLSELNSWYENKHQGLSIPIYSSFDIRDSGNKIVPVDANIFPAGFNNICGVDKGRLPEKVTDFFSHIGLSVQTVFIITEEHTNNAYYWENVRTLYEAINHSVENVRLVMAKPIDGPLTVKTSEQYEIQVHELVIKAGEAYADNLKADYLVSNNDFSVEYPEYFQDLKVPLNPPYQVGWHNRRKQTFFEYYNQLVTEFCELIDINPWHMHIKTIAFNEFDIANPESLTALSEKTREFYQQLKSEYAEQGEQALPYFFVKNSAGTYGLGVQKVSHPDEITGWNNKARKKMKAAKGGGRFSEVIIQEGVSTALKSGESTAEPAVYLLGSQLAGGFLRSHHKKDATESLNSPGAVYEKMCVSDLKVDVKCCVHENVYGWVAKLGLLAIATEIKQICKS